jgi:hypothetical protein
LLRRDRLQLLGNGRLVGHGHQEIETSPTMDIIRQLCVEMLRIGYH